MSKRDANFYECKARSLAYQWLSKEAHKSRMRGASKMAGLYLIEGAYVTADALAERMGRDKESALKKLARVRAMPGPITWSKLGVV